MTQLIKKLQEFTEKRNQRLRVPLRQPQRSYPAGRQSAYALKFQPEFVTILDILKNLADV
ncbi:hypothetical protein [Nostoc sp. LPT]|uniref:hypothetical protein n=1 Tax=Nostoc sp. LPT TaxID=2815387 RepID=UPI001D83198F|nr:hypothetical protein [Nostoc sp. LPT]MBN4003979.1 hypothetical protein [Nostoc sp. LPT]